MPYILNVAEKPSVAKTISSILSNNQYHKLPGNHYLNPIYEFQCHVPQFHNQLYTMVFTSVLGHLLTYQYQPPYDTNWSTIPIEQLFTAPIIRNIIQTPDNKHHKLIQCLEQQAVRCHKLILWLDCDREGENIAYEVYEVCSRKNQLLHNNVHRAHFSALIPSDIIHSLSSLTPPNINWSNAVDTRAELDLRLGAIFTRLQTINFQSKYNISNVISWGPCQFPTLGFIVDRYLQRENFITNKYYTITVSILLNNMKCTLKWNRNRLYDRYVCVILYDTLLESPTLYITNKQSRSTAKYRPVPLSTTEMQKKCSRYLHINSTQSMEYAEKLYQKGLISYPRTETDKFKSGTDLLSLIQQQTNSPQWGTYAHILLTQNKYCVPRDGGHDDSAHPPIHPTKFDETLLSSLTINEQKVYEFISRHFLACCSYDAVGETTTIHAEIRNTQLHCVEQFTTSGLIIKERNYLDIYVYEHWSNNLLPDININDQYQPSELLMNVCNTEPPVLLSESDLITCMDENGIGTDATIATHIKTIQDREYCYLNSQKQFVPTDLGLVLVQGYEKMGLQMSKPNLRAHVELLLSGIANGSKDMNQVKNDVLNDMKLVYRQVVDKLDILDHEFSMKFSHVSTQAIQQQNSTVIQQQFTKCGQCNMLMSLKQYTAHHNRIKRFLYCGTCNKQLNLPDRGLFTPHQHICPMPLDSGAICNYQILSCTNETTSRQHQLCPRCYQSPPQQQIEQLGDTYNSQYGFRCFNCTYKQCPISTGVSQQSIRKCQYCSDGDMILRMKLTELNNKSYYTQCTVCKSSMSLNNVNDADITTVECTNGCQLSNHTAARLITLTYNSNMIPSNLDNPITLCIGGCENELMNTLMLTIRQSTNNSSSSTSVVQHQRSYTTSTIQRNYSSGSNSERKDNGYNNNYESKSYDNSNNIQYNRSSTRSTNTATASNTTNNACFKCGSTDHWANNCISTANQPRNYTNITSNNSNANRVVTCYKCHEVGHVSTNCPNR